MTVKILNLACIVLTPLLISCSSIQQQSIDKLNLSLSRIEYDAIKGIDSNNNGIRDDVELFISQLHISNDQKQFALEYVFHLQEILLSDENLPCTDIEINNEYLTQKSKLLFQVSGNLYGKELLNILEEKQLNTTTRLNKYNKFITKALQCYKQL